jgi:hypothetical protein
VIIFGMIVFSKMCSLCGFSSLHQAEEAARLMEQAEQEALQKVAATQAALDALSKERGQSQSLVQGI